MIGCIILLMLYVFVMDVEFDDDSSIRRYKVLNIDKRFYGWFNKDYNYICIS